MDKQGMTVVNPASIAQRAEALEKAEQDVAGKGGETDAASKVAADKIDADKLVADKAAADKTAAEGKAAEEKNIQEVKTKKAPNDPDELRKWNTKVSQENSKMRDELRAIRSEQEKTYKLLASLSKKPIDYKELAKNPEAIQKLVEDEKEGATRELQEKLEALSTEAKAKDTAYERVKREHDAENYPEWKRVFPTIVKLAQGPAGQGDPRVDYTKPAGEVLDALYELALQESPTPVVAPLPPAVVEKTYTEAEYKAALADAIAKEKIAIDEAAKKEAAAQAQKELAEENKGGTVAGVGKGAGRVPSDHLAAFKKMSLNEQRDWLIQQQTQQ